VHEEAGAPALDGLRPNERRVTALLHAWRDAACEVAGESAEMVRDALGPLIQQFRTALRSGASGRQTSGKPRASRRAVIAAIDRIGDAFLAIDVSTGRIVDANPAAGALLGVERDALLEIDAISFVPKSAHACWEAALEGVAESENEQEFESLLKDIHGETIAVENRITGFSTRRRTLALVLTRLRLRLRHSRRHLEEACRPPPSRTVVRLAARARREFSLAGHRRTRPSVPRPSPRFSGERRLRGSRS
jgi:PAS domain-containing protein